MNPFRRPIPRDGEVHWLSPAPIRHRRARLPSLIVLVAPIALIAIVAVGIVAIAPKPNRGATQEARNAQAGGQPGRTAQLGAPSKPAVAVTPPRIREAAQPRQDASGPATGQAYATASSAPAASAMQPSIRAAAPGESLFDVPVTAETAQPAPITDPAPVASISQFPDSAPAAKPAEPPAAADDQKAVELAGAFPAPAESPAASPDGLDYAVYFDEAAPDEQQARALLGEVQKKYGEKLAGGRLTYRRVRVGEATMYRVRMSGLTQTRASELCDSLKQSGGGCEVGPR